VTVYLPWVDRAPAQVDEHRSTAVPGSETVLLVDDDAAVRAVAQKALMAVGYHVVAVEGGLQALVELQRRAGAVDLLLTDVVMPGLSGPDLASRALSEYPRIRVLFMSGYQDETIARHGVLADGVQFIAKPYRLDALRAKVRAVLDA